MTKKIELRFGETSIEKSIRLAIRREMEKYYKKQDKEIARLVLTKLIHDCRIEIVPNRREENVLRSTKNKDE